MLEQRFIGQPDTETVLAALSGLLSTGQYTSLAGSVAYAVSSGTDALARESGRHLAAMNSRWLVGIDWGRSQPIALDALASLPRSVVRVFDGRNVVDNPNCWPNVSYHPKGFALSSKACRAVLLGSANLSRNGLTRGKEADLLIRVSNPRTKAEVSAWNVIGQSLKWFHRLWRDSSPWAEIRDDYIDVYPSLRARQGPVPTDEDAGRTVALNRRRGYSHEDLVLLASADAFWTDTGNLHGNRGQGRPGSQLMLRALTRVFFEFEARDVPKKSHIGEIDIEFGGTVHRGRTVIYAHNGMDELNLPLAGEDGSPQDYDQATVLFRRVAQTGRTVYRLSIAGAGDRSRWKAQSHRIGRVWNMRPSPREFGVF